jgi:methylaspartate mutase epsilon subunit
VTLGRFAAFVARAREEGVLVVQPRMGFGTVAEMRAGLSAVRSARARVIGTLTLDSYTRVNDHTSARLALMSGAELNGYPLIAHGAPATRAMLDGLFGDDFPVQVRHGSALPYEVMRTLLESGLDATEGGPVSYCLPYSRVPLADATAEWARCCELLAARSDHGIETHLESFGGCMLGQLCPPGLLVALTVLEGMFFRQHGLRSISLSYAQQTDPDQDAEAVAALRRLAGELLGDVDQHVVLYTYMGVFPRSPVGAFRILESSVRLALRTGAERLIVKTRAEAQRIPTIAENVEALEFADAAHRLLAVPAGLPVDDTGVYDEARRLVEAVLELSRGDVGTALVRAFRRGVLDVPYCLHPDNANQARAVVDGQGRLQWARAGGMPVETSTGAAAYLSSRQLLQTLAYNQRHFDREELAGTAAWGAAA